MTGQKRYDDTRNERPDIAFVGVWDTVSAYGGPIAEVTRAIDNWIFPLSMPDYELNAKVKYARHALALDDERDAFHPLLWDEVHEATLVDEEKVTKNRLQQVWFTGMHSDVGGGYPDESLSYVSLLWMMEEAEKGGRAGGAANAEGDQGPLRGARQQRRADPRQPQGRRGVLPLSAAQDRRLARPRGRADLRPARSGDRRRQRPPEGPADVGEGPRERHLADRLRHRSLCTHHAAEGLRSLPAADRRRERAAGRQRRPDGRTGGARRAGGRGDARRAAGHTTCGRVWSRRRSARPEPRRPKRSGTSSGGAASPTS